MLLKAETRQQYFRLERPAQQGNSTSADFFILCLKILFFITKNEPKKEGIEIFNYSDLNNTYVDDATFFLKIESLFSFL